jgi:hypothetical protein
MAGIVVPVILHLWNDRQGKVLAIGSIALLEKRSSRRAWSRRLSEWWLLLLRCLLLIVLALLLAGPVWKRGSGVREKGWVLVDSAVVVQTEGTVYKPLMDSLAAAGYERHVMSEVNYWEAYQAADREAPAGAPFVVFSTGWVSRFGGERPSTFRPVRWYTYTPKDSVRHWTAAAWLTPSDSIRVLEGSSGPTGSYYRARMLSRDSPLAVKVDTAALRITIYMGPEYIQDGRYLAAGLRALASFSGRKIRLNIAGSMDAVSGEMDWLFWLSPAPLPLEAKTVHVLRYEPGKAVAVGTWLRGEPGIGITKEIEGGEGYAAVWEDGYGRCLLGREDIGNGEPIGRPQDSEGRRVYHYFSRMDPGWNGLVWSRSFPVLLSRLLFEGGLDEAQDRRVLDPEQVVPVKRGDRVGKTEESLLDLGPVCWVLLLLLFILERVVSFVPSPNKRSY